MDMRIDSHRIKGVIFDMDGTLLDSMGMWRTMGIRYLASKGKTAEEDLDRKVADMTLLQGASYMKETYGLSEDPETILKEMFDSVEVFYREQVCVRPGIPELLEELHRAGISMCVASATDTYLVEQALAHTGIRNYFEQIYCTREIGAGKESDRIYQLCREYMGTEVYNTWVFEDALYAARTAAAAGFPLVAVADSSEPAQEELRSIATIYLKEFTEWPGLV